MEVSSQPVVGPSTCLRGMFCPCFSSIFIALQRATKTSLVIEGTDITFLHALRVLRFLGTTFLGNFIISVLLLVPVLVMQFVYRSKTQDRPMTPAEQATKDHRDYVADNVQAWFIWAAFNLHVEWWLHILVEIVPRVFIFAFRIVWGNVGQKVLSLAGKCWAALGDPHAILSHSAPFVWLPTEFYNAIKGYIKPILYAALGWGSWAILFNSIYGLYTHSDPQTSRASYTYRLYQVVEFFVGDIFHLLPRWLDALS